jgi:hypothetical protein
MRTMRILTVFIVLICVGSTDASYSYSADFESPTYTLGGLNGQDGWTVSGPDQTVPTANVSNTPLSNGSTGSGSQWVTVDSPVGEANTIIERTITPDEYLFTASWLWMPDDRDSGDSMSSHFQLRDDSDDFYFYAWYRINEPIYIVTDAVSVWTSTGINPGEQAFVMEVEIDYPSHKQRFSITPVATGIKESTPWYNLAYGRTLTIAEAHGGTFWMQTSYGAIDDFSLTSIPEGGAVDPCCGDSDTVYLLGDFDVNCYVNFNDFVVMAESWLDAYTTLDLFLASKDWLKCTDPTVAECDIFWKIDLIKPLPYEVVQRTGYVPSYSHEHYPGSSLRGSGSVPIECKVPNFDNLSFEYRTVTLAGAFGEGIDWTPINLVHCSSSYCGTAEIPAGGRYRLYIRAIKEGHVVAMGSVEPIGIGEVFVVAGEENAAGTGEELIAVDDPYGRVVSYDTAGGTWAVANDPQPNLGDGGTIWIPMCNRMVPLLQVPIGLIPVAGSGGSSYWLPGQSQYANLLAAGQVPSSFRAVLWQQGESDASLGISTNDYVDNLTAIRTSLNTEWGFDVPWILAKSTLDPSTSNPVGEQQIRDAIAQLWATNGFMFGPDTDILDGDNRDSDSFTGTGQQNAGDLWFFSLWNAFYCE